MKFSIRTYKWILACVAFTWTQILPAQNGGAFFADFHLTGKARQIKAYGMVQDFEGNMHMATIGGVVVFDGTTTTLVGTGVGTNVLEHVADNLKTYAGCDGRIGYIKRNNFGKFVFTRIPLDGVDDQSFTNIFAVGKDVYFQSTDWVIRVTDDKVTSKWKRPAEGDFSGIFAIKNVLFVNVSGSGLYTLEAGGKFKKHPVNDSRIAEQLLVFCTPRADNEMVLGTDNNELFVFNGAQLTQINIDKSAYLQSKLLVAGKKLDNTYMVVSTFTGGLMVINMYNGIVAEMYNTSTGFPVDEVNCITIDKNQGIWASHEMGITRIDRNIPVRFFSAYPGLTARVYSLAETNGNLFVGCADGLYQLSAVENLAEYERLLQQQSRINQEHHNDAKGSGKPGSSKTDDPDDPENTNPEPANSNTPDKAESSPDPGSTTNPSSTDETAIDRAGKRIKDIRNRIKDRVRGGTGTGGTDKGTDNPKGESAQKGGGYSYYIPTEHKTIYKFAAVGQNTNSQFVYKKVPGISSKVRKILITPNRLICVTNTGLYEYSGGVIKRLCEGDIKDAVVSGSRLVFISTRGPQILEANGVIHDITINPKYRNLATTYLDNQNTLWLGGINQVLKVTLGPYGTVVKEKLIEVPSEFPDNIHICRTGDITYFASGGGIFEYQQSNESAVQSNIPLPQDNELFEYRINANGNTLFVKTIEGWKELKGRESIPMGLMDVLEGVWYVSKGTTGNVWAVNNAGNIYYLNRSAPSIPGYSGFNVFIRGVLGFNGTAFDLSDLNISYKEGTVEIQWGSNLYLQSDGTWYQFKIQGTGNNNWSQWTKATSYKVSLNPGKYTFIVRARDILGKVSPERKLSFYIQPPFWQTWWFYSIMALVLGGAIYFVFRWRNRALIENQKRLESMVKERTVELAEEKEKTEELLLNILPKAVAQELKTLGQSSVRRHSDSAVMFTDFCNFTKLSMNMSAEELVERLDSYFRKFDEIIEKYALEKIKTIGDAYMCAAGVPQPRINCSLAIVMAALEILEVVEKAESRWQIRVGIHHGGLVSGVVGKKKFAYDIWGDTVNVASRMESSSEPMNINVTEQVYEQIKDYFECEKRGEIEAKSLGKTNMYFVKGLKVKYRMNGSAIVPNKEFLALLN
ncbi:MAG: hypothetical protein KG003_00555 [Bacteroidetes bacterium]|nr:hypothetical protein [Bacteroidota bacterium]